MTLDEKLIALAAPSKLEIERQAPHLTGPSLISSGPWTSWCCLWESLNYSRWPPVLAGSVPPLSCSYQLLFLSAKVANFVDGAQNSIQFDIVQITGSFSLLMATWNLDCSSWAAIASFGRLPAGCLISYSLPLPETARPASWDLGCTVLSRIASSDCQYSAASCCHRQYACGPKRLCNPSCS